MLRRALVLTVLTVLAVVAAASGCRPLLDGGWDGTATCDGDVFPLTAVFNEDGEGEVNGTIYIEGFLLAGFIAKGIIENGERDPDDGTYELQLETDDDDTAEFAVELEYSDDTFEELEGTADILNDEGETVDTCQVELDRVSVND